MTEKKFNAVAALDVYDNDNGLVSDLLLLNLVWLLLRLFSLSTKNKIDKSKMAEIRK